MLLFMLMVVYDVYVYVKAKRNDRGVCQNVPVHQRCEGLFGQMGKWLVFLLFPCESLLAGHRHETFQFNL